MAAFSLASFHYKTLFISDLHLGSNKTAAPYLYELLCHLDFKMLEDIYLVGDVIGGWEHQNAKQQAFPEMEKRILDVLNYAAGQGVRLHFITGNHDEKMRPLLPLLQARRAYDVFEKTISFTDDALCMAGDIKLKIIHGDQHDPSLFVKPWFRPVTMLVNILYDRLVDLNYHIATHAYHYLGLHVSFAKCLKSAFKWSVGFVSSHRSLMKGLENADYDGVLMGHTHMAGIQVLENAAGKKTYLINDGDWVESCTAAYVDASGGLPKILNYKQEREARGFGSLPDVDDPHPDYFALYRTRTERQVRMLQKLWPARDRTKCFAAYRHALRKIRDYRADKMTLHIMLAKLDALRCMDMQTRNDLARIVLATRQGSYRGQKKGLRKIFANYGAGERLLTEDLLFCKVLVREFMTRCDRKIRKHAKQLEDAAQRLDFSKATAQDAMQRHIVQGNTARYLPMAELPVAMKTA